jgi:hypothetical protein
LFPLCSGESSLGNMGIFSYPYFSPSFWTLSKIGAFP